MTHTRMWVGTVVVVGLLGGLVLFGNQDSRVGVAGADSAVKKVKCDTGQTLTEALKKAKPGDTLQVTVTCHERVTITTDRLALDGDGSAVLDGVGGGPTEFEGVVTIDGVHGVTLTGFTIQNGPGEGILGFHGVAFAVLDTTVQDNTGTGSSFQGGPLTVRNNGVGLLADGAGTLSIVSDPSKLSSIADNGTDADLKFGTRMTFDGVTIGTITCNTTVLSRGTTVCP
jgi:hypothetical protein